MDTVVAKCPECGKSYDVPAAKLGKLAKCNQCSTVFMTTVAGPMPPNQAPPVQPPPIPTIAAPPPDDAAMVSAKAAPAAKPTTGILLVAIVVLVSIGVAAGIVYLMQAGVFNGDSPRTAPSGGPAQVNKPQPPPADEIAGKPADLPAARQGKILVLSNLGPQPMPTPTYAQIEAAYPVIQRAPFDKAGFNAVSLPFLFVSKDGAGDPVEALAFSFLLSHSLDWSPGCRCTRHAYFVFKRDGMAMQALAQSYNDHVIFKTIKGWGATHAVGGTITAGKDGYSGTLVIYDTQAVVHQKEFAEPREYFTLLGDMIVEAMTFLDEKPSEDLSKFLHAKRCQPQSIIDLGKAAFLPERGVEEFGLYANILKRDPGFADVRYWWANQKQWDDDDHDFYHRQVATAMDAYPVTGVFELQNDQKKYPHFPAWLDQIRKIIGKDSPLAIRLELAGERADAAGTVNPDHGQFGPLMDRLKGAVGKYPNDYWLAYETADAMSMDVRFADPDAAAALFAIAGMSNYMTGYANHHDAADGLMRVLTHDCGRSDWGAALAIKHAKHWQAEGDVANSADCLARAGLALMQLGRYEEAANYLEQAAAALKPCGMRDCAVVNTGVALALSGQRDRLDAFIQANEKFGQTNRILSVWQGYLDLLDGKKVNVAGLQAGPPPPTWESGVAMDQLCSQVHYLQGYAHGREQMTATLRGEPENRLSWALFDAFDRRWPEAQSAAFYDSLAWLHGDDPWVQQAIADFRKRTPKGLYKTADELLTMLHAYEPVRWPVMVRNDANRRRDFYVLNAAPAGAFAAAIHGLLVTKDYAKANELALRFHHLVGDGPQAMQTPMYANHLIYLVEAASPKPLSGK